MPTAILRAISGGGGASPARKSRRSASPAAAPSFYWSVLPPLPSGAFRMEFSPDFSGEPSPIRRRDRWRDSQGLSHPGWKDGCSPRTHGGGGSSMIVGGEFGWSSNLGENCGMHGAPVETGGFLSSIQSGEDLGDWPVLHKPQIQQGKHRLIMAPGAMEQKQQNAFTFSSTTAWGLKREKELLANEIKKTTIHLER